MTIVWVLEKAKDPATAVAGALMGDFAVRVFASMGSFATILKFNRRSHPDLVVVDAEDASVDQEQVAAFLATHFFETPAIVLTPAASAWGDQAGFCVAEKPIDGLRLSTLADYLIRNQGGSRHIVRYRDLVLDLERLQCLLLPGDDTVSLPLKEAQILKLLLGKAGQCLSRDEISEALWAGVKVTPRTIDSHVSRLRKRLRDMGVTIDSVYGGGYVLR